ncbi:MAG: hypothetical protein ACOCZ8_02340 [Bacteroidota bacterium]
MMLRKWLPAFIVLMLLAACGDMEYDDNFTENVDSDSEKEEAVGFYDPTANMPGKMTKAMHQKLQSMQTEQGQLNILEFLRSNSSILELNILGDGLDDETVRISNLRPWLGADKAYAGEYNGPYSSPIARIQLDGDGKQFDGSITIQEEQVTEQGILEPKTEEKHLEKIALSGSLISWAPPAEHLAVQSGQFVTWTQGEQQHQGLLVYDQNAETNAFTLLTKTVE